MQGPAIFQLHSKYIKMLHTLPAEIVDNVITSLDANETEKLSHTSKLYRNSLKDVALRKSCREHFENAKLQLSKVWKAPEISLEEMGDGDVFLHFYFGKYTYSYYYWGCRCRQEIDIGAPFRLIYGLGADEFYGDLESYMWEDIE